MTTDWLGRFVAKRGLGACICEAQEISAALDEIERLRAALRRIRYAGNDSHPTAIWMQTVAAHAMEPQWPNPGEQPNAELSRVPDRSEA